jgi:glycerophosphoryl diester phosphodiesterase
MIRPYPLVTAHSGCMGEGPNSREHLRRALEEGADIVELDIRLSADGHVVLSHDDAVLIPGGESLPIARHGWKELSREARGRGLDLLDLEEAFDLLAGSGRGINLDAKEPEAAAAAAALARGRGLEDSIIFSGLGEAEARLVREKLPDFRCLLNADLLLPASGYGEKELRAIYRSLTESGCCGINIDWRAAGAPLMEYARRRCIPVLLWTIDMEEDLRKALELQPYSITTNRPDLLVGILEKGAKKGKIA